MTVATIKLCRNKESGFQVCHSQNFHINKLKACEIRGMIPRNAKDKATSLANMSSQAMGYL